MTDPGRPHTNSVVARFEGGWRCRVEAGGFDFWRDVPADAHGEDVLSQQRVMARRGAAGILPSGAYHQQSGTTIPHRSASAIDLLPLH